MNCQTHHRHLTAPGSSVSSLGSLSFTKALSTRNHSSSEREATLTCPLEAMNAQPFWILDDSTAGKSKKNRQSVKKERTMTFFSKIFSGQVKAAALPPRKTRKSVGAASESPPASPGTTATTGFISRDATKFFEERRREKEAKREKPRRQQSNDSLLGAILDIPNAAESTATTTNKKITRRHSITSGCNAENSSTFLPSTALPSQKSYRIASENTSNESTRSSARATSSRVQHSVTSPRDLAIELSLNQSVDVVPEQQDDDELFDPVVEASVDKSYHRAHDKACHDSADGGGHCIEISPGFSLPLRGSQETLRAVRQRQIATATCLCCGESVHAIQDAAMIICPTCRTIVPFDDSPSGHGLALGFATWDLPEIQKAAFAMTEKSRF
jgi:hypothetical protein